MCKKGPQYLSKEDRTETTSPLATPATPLVALPPAPGLDNPRMTRPQRPTPAFRVL